VEFNLPLLNDQWGHEGQAYSAGTCIVFMLSTVEFNLPLLTLLLVPL
jgi:hypothetical protein